MKRWAIFTIFLYAAALLLLAMPVAALAFGGWGKNNSGMSLSEIVNCYAAWQYWLWLAVLLAGQFLLLLLPINIAERRLPARRPLKIPVIVTAFFLANLFIAGVVSVLCAIFLDGASNIFELFSLSTTFNAQPNNAKISVAMRNMNVDSKSYITTQFSTNIGSMRWSSPFHTYKGFWLYNENGSFFTPRSVENYSLRVQYSPDVALWGKQGRIYLYSCYGGS